MYTIDPAGPWNLYTVTIPTGATVHGTIAREDGFTGALIQMHTGIYTQMNAGVMRSLEQRQVQRALRDAVRHPLAFTRREVRVLLDALNAHLAGDPTEGDLCWTEAQCETAARVRLMLITYLQREE
jgi:hypothetical protein